MKIDLHVHTSEVSFCGHMSGGEIAEAYKEKGYDLIVITNHFNTYTANRLENEKGVSDFFRYYNDMYLYAKEEGEKRGLTVLNGYEIRFDGADNDYLIYGMPDATAARYKELFKMSPKDFSAIANEEGFLFYQAHPFRNGMKIINPAYLFGIEIRNGNPRHDSRNDIAEAWAKKYGMHEIAGSDCHQPEDAGVTGIITERQIKTEHDLLSMLRDDDYSIL
jgi:predicted metal-dependent phosphoesterase TrpH